MSYLGTTVYPIVTLPELVTDSLGYQPADANTVTQLNTTTGVYANAAYNAANTANFEVAIVNQRALSAGEYANSAFGAANTSNSNAATADQKAVISGVYANSAYLQANTATTDAASVRLHANGAYIQANSASNIANTVDQKAVSAGSYANSAYNQANTSTTNAATADQKAVSAGSYANSAFGVANTADQRVVTSGVYANAAYNVANTAVSNVQSASSYANSAYTQANTATTNAATADQRAVTSGSYANSAYTVANTFTTFVNSGGTINGKLDVVVTGANLVQQLVGTSGVFSRIGTTTSSFYTVHNGTTDTFLYTQEAAALRLGTSSTERMRITSAGNVGIGRTPNASNKLEVTGTINARTSGTSGSTEVWAQAHDFWETPTYSGTAIHYYGSAVAGTAFGVPLANLGRLNFQNVSNALIGVNGAVPIIFGTTSLERMRLTADGDLGIGTTSPNAKLEIALVSAPGGAGFYGGANHLRLLAASGSAFGEPSIKFQEAGTDVGAVIAGKNTANGSMDLIFGNRSSASTTSSLTEKLRIAQDGNIRMGDAAAAVNTLRFFDIYNADTGVNAGVIQRLITSNVAGTGNVTVDIVKYKNGSFTINNNETNAAAYTAFGIGGTERMRITSTGNVSIGTTNTINNALVNVNGGINTTSGIVGYLTSDAFTLNGKTQPQYGVNFSATGSTPIGISGYYGISMATSGLERLRIATNGNIGLGTINTPVEVTLPTSSTLGWEQNAGDSIANIFRQSSSAALVLGSGVKYSSTVNGFKSSYAAAWARSAISVGYGTIIFSVAPEATVPIGTDTTVNERMRITSVGDVVIGATAAGYTATNRRVLTINGGTGGTEGALLSFAQGGTNKGYVFSIGNNMEFWCESGQVIIGTAAASSISLKTSNLERMSINSAGAVSIPGALSAGTITETSSRDLKTNFRPVENALEKVLKLTAYIYDRKDGSETDELGLIAEEVDPVINNLVMYDDEGKPVGVKYTRVGVLCLEAIKEMHKELMELKAQVNR